VVVLESPSFTNTDFDQKDLNEYHAVMMPLIQVYAQWRIYA